MYDIQYMRFIKQYPDLGRILYIIHIAIAIIIIYFMLSGFC